MSIRAVIFDVDNTLYSYDDAHASAFRALSEYAAQTFGLPAEAFSALHRETMREQEVRAGGTCAAIHNRLLRYQLLLEKLGRPVSLAPAMAERYWSVFLRAMRPYPGLYACFAFLKDRGCSIGIGTNMTADYQYAKLERLEVLEDVDFLVTSEEVGVEKPDRRVFDFCARKAGCPPAACLFVGDNPVHDVRGSRDAGMNPVWMCPDRRGEDGAPLPPETAGVPRIRSLSELPALFAALSGG